MPTSDGLLLAIVTRQAALNHGRPVRLEQIAAQLSTDVTFDELTAALGRLADNGALYPDAGGWRIRAVPIGPDATGAYVASARLKS